jgi:CRP-like cAMP-binding protein
MKPRSAVAPACTPASRALSTRPLLSTLLPTGQVSERVLVTGTPVVREGTRPTEVFIVVTGLVELSRRRGAHRATIDVVHPGEPFADVETLTCTAMRADARTLVTSRLASLDAQLFLRALASNTSVSLCWLAGMATRLGDLEARLGDLGTVSVETRLAALLLEESHRGEVTLSQYTLAGLLGVHRSSVNRLVRQLQASQLVTVGYRRIRIIDREGLEKLVTASVSPGDPARVKATA